MSIINNAQSVLSNQFGGADQLNDEVNIVPPNAIALSNCEFIGQSVTCRRGFNTAWAAGVSIASMWDWFQDTQNYLIYLDVGGATPKISKYDLVGSLGISDVVTGLTGAVGMSNAGVGFREIMATFNKEGIGASQAYVWDGTYFDATSNAEPLFPHAPVLGSQIQAFVFTEPSTSVPSITAGLHNFGIVITTYNGQTTPPGPDGIAIGQNLQSFTASGGKSINIELQPQTLWPNAYNTVQIVMTPVNNPNRYFLVPGTIANIPRGSALAVNITFAIDDVTLLDEGTDVTSTLFQLYTQTSTGTGPFNPHCVLAYGQRMVYITRLPAVTGNSSTQGALFASEPSNPYYITLQFHLLQLPEFLDTVTGAVLNATLYIFGPDWTFSFSDNTQYPVEWSPCVTISRNIGSPFIKGVTTNIARNVMWVCSKIGLFAFSGAAYTIQPCTYMQGAADWEMINWNAPAGALEVVDYPDKHLVVVKAPLGANQQTANYLLAWDYSFGYDSASIRYCGKWSITDANGSPITPSCIAMVHSNNAYEELWMASYASPLTSPVVLRQKYVPIDAPALPSEPTALYNDLINGKQVGIAQTYQPGPPTPLDMLWYQWLGAMFRARGSGTMFLQPVGPDGTNPVLTVAPINLAWTPGQTNLRLWDQQAQEMTVVARNFQVAGTPPPAGSFFWLSAIRYFYQQWLTEGNQ